MTVDERQHLVERFVSGEMSSTEANAFRARVNSDDELRRLLSAEHLIARAFARDRAMLVVSADEPADGLVAALRASRAPSTVRRTGVRRWISGAIAGAIGLVGIGIGIGALLSGPSSDFETPRRADAIRSLPPTVAQQAESRVPSDESSAKAESVFRDANSRGRQHKIRYRDVARTNVQKSIAQPSTLPVPNSDGLQQKANDESISPRADIDARPVESLPEFVESQVKFEVKVEGR